MEDRTFDAAILKDMDMEDRMVWLAGEEVVDVLRKDGPDAARTWLGEALSAILSTDEGWAERALDVATVYAEEELWWASSDIAGSVLGCYERDTDAVSREDALLALGLALEDPEVWRRIEGNASLAGSDGTEGAVSVAADDLDAERMAAYRTLARAAADGDVESLSSLLRCFFEDCDEWPSGDVRIDVLPKGCNSIGLSMLLSWIGDPVFQGWLSGVIAKSCAR